MNNNQSKKILSAELPVNDSPIYQRIGNDLAIETRLLFSKPLQKALEAIEQMDQTTKH